MSKTVSTDWSTATDEDLVARIVASKDPQLFAILYDRYADLMYNKCLSFVANTDEAKDLTHDIFLKLYISLRKFNGRSKFSTWLYSLVYNHCVNYVQRERKSNQEKLFDTAAEKTEFTDEDEIDDELIFSMKFEKLEKAMNQIDADDKRILLMKYQDDFTINDLCMAYELTESAVKMRLHRAKSKLITIYNQM